MKGAFTTNIQKLKSSLTLSRYHETSGSSPEKKKLLLRIKKVREKSDLGVVFRLQCYCSIECLLIITTRCVHDYKDTFSESTWGRSIEGTFKRSTKGHSLLYGWWGANDQQVLVTVTRSRRPSAPHATHLSTTNLLDRTMPTIDKLPMFTIIIAAKQRQRSTDRRVTRR